MAGLEGLRMKNKYDIIIVGTGAAGLFAALHLPKDKQIAMLSKAGLEESDSFLAQGGICVLKNEDDYPAFFEDTLRAGHYENDCHAVDLMIRSSQDTIRRLIDLGVEFERDQGEFCYTKEGAHTACRILYHEDLTGKEITSKLLKQVEQCSNITLFSHTTMVDILEEDGTCYGVVVENSDGDLVTLECDYTIWACGGVGGLYQHSTNFRHLTGDALAISLKHGITLENIDYVQIHPTTLYSEKAGRRFLISESVRGEGAILLDQNGERFVDELLPRDLLTQELRKQMKKEGTKYVRLSLKKMTAEEIIKRFPNIYRTCLEEGYDLTKEPVPVVPAQHYFMGGVKVDQDGRTSMNRLYAAGETACNGVHGANRLASNSLLESLVWARRAAEDIVRQYEPADAETSRSCVERCTRELAEKAKSQTYVTELLAAYHDMVREAMDREWEKRKEKSEESQ